MKYTVSELSEHAISCRAGNCKSLDFPCKEVPKSILNLHNAPPNTGHDLNLNGFFALLDIELSKRLRCLLLYRYGRYINVVSSASLMHRPDLAGGILEDVDSKFSYGISVAVNLRLIKKMCAELMTIRHIDTEIDEFVSVTEEILLGVGLNIPEPIACEDLEFTIDENALRTRRIDVFAGRTCTVAGEIIISNVSLVVLEQYLRYTSGTLHLDISYNTLFLDNYKITDRIHSVSSFITCEQARIIVEQRKNHKMKDWRAIVEKLQDVFFA